MGPVLKYVERTKAGSWQYRRRVPQSVSAVITKRGFKSKLGESEREALAAYPRYHAEVERLIEAAKRGQAVAVGSMTEREAYAEALRRRADLPSGDGHEQVRSIVAAIAGDHAAAARVELVLPETGVCSGSGPQVADVGSGCCGGPAVAHADACCAADETARDNGASGCGCAGTAGPAKTPACC